MYVFSRVRSEAWRSRWAAVGAAVAVTLGAGGMVAVNAASSAPSSFVSVDPTRILDTRTDVGLTGPFVSGVAQKLQVSGTVPTQPPGGAAPVNATVVPATATAVVFNVTAVRPATGGFLSIRPGDATGVPATSNINFGAGGPNIANAVTVQLPATGMIDIYVQGTLGEVLIDVAGYYLPAAAGPPGPQGDVGPQGPSNGYVARNAGFVGFEGTSVDQTVATLDLPAGSYLVTATLMANNNDPAITNIGCRLDLNAIQIDDFATDLFFPLSATGAGGERESISMTGAGTLAVAGTANVICRSSGSGNWSSRTITAIQVADLSSTAFAPDSVSSDALE